jgi:hypothetical protein
MNNLNIAVYGQGILYPSSSLSALTPSIQQAGWTSVIFSLFHIGRTSAGQIEGDIYYNDTLIISNGAYVGDSGWPAMVNNLKGGLVTTLLASVGGATPWVEDFQTIQAIYQGNSNSFEGTNLQANFNVLKKLFPAIDAIDMDCEETYDQVSFVAFCEMLIVAGFSITFCPYDSGEYDFWTGSLAELEEKYPGQVVWWNLQCYAGGSGNDPATWAGFITEALPGFNTDGYILASDWSRFWDSNYDMWEGDCPEAVAELLAPFAGDSAVGGAFIWTLDQILEYDQLQKKHPDSACAGSGGSMTAYVNAIESSL